MKLLGETTICVEYFSPSIQDDSESFYENLDVKVKLFLNGVLTDLVLNNCTNVNTHYTNNFTPPWLIRGAPYKLK